MRTLHLALILLLSISPILAFAQNLPIPTISSDLDQDGMDDAWEKRHGLDPTSPVDAWTDWDGDGVANLFEFRLGSAPLDTHSPQVIELTPEQGIDGLRQILEDYSVSDLLYIRIATGTYQPDRPISNARTGIRMLLQGGWNADFTVHDPQQFTTIFSDPQRSGGRLDMKLSDVYSAIIYQHLDFIEMSAPVQFTCREESETYVALHECNIKNTRRSFGGALDFRTADIKSNLKLDLVSCEITQNNANGLEVLIFADNEFAARILNCTIAHNKRSTDNSYTTGYGLNLLFYQFVQQSTPQILIQNSIIQNNARHSINFTAPSGVNLSGFRLESNNIETPLEGLPAIILQTGSNIDEAPSFADTLAGNFSLQANSPGIDQGTSFGLPFSGAAPDMGAYEFNFTPTNRPTPTVNTLTLYPNPVRNLLHIEWDKTTAEDLQLEIFRYDGRLHQKLLSTHVPAGTYTYRWDVTNLARGYYFLRYHDGDQFITRPFFKA